jgi:hypothetical protein
MSGWHGLDRMDTDSGEGAKIGVLEMNLYLHRCSRGKKAIYSSFLLLKNFDDDYCNSSDRYS